MPKGGGSVGNVLCLNGLHWAPLWRQIIKGITCNVIPCCQYPSMPHWSGVARRLHVLEEGYPGCGVTRGSKRGQR